MGHHHHLDYNLPAPEFLLDDKRTESSFEEIPVIDLSDADSTDYAARRALADRIRDACINVKNHGIPEDLVSAAVEAGKKFFALPKADKMQGYTPLLGENTDPEGRGDLHEGFDLGWEDSGDAASYDGAMSGGNVWPENLPEHDFRNPVLEYYHSAVRLGQKLFPLFALALDLPEDFFIDKTTKPAAIMRLLHYPPQNASSADEDGKCFTILWQDTVPALQVMNADGKWIDAVPISGTLVLNLGDQFARWTNDVFKSTLHRAINRSGAERYSMPLFFGTDYDVLLEPIPGCVSPEYPSKYKVVTAGEYVKSRLEATYSHSVPNY
ncbi:hypothetical protein CPB85DRAFT_1326496 [Mucidula mucida]|nr:hypothetical protein CPB85DRAFT_1326496 [Mucidula mucida]